MSAQPRIDDVIIGTILESLPQPIAEFLNPLCLLYTTLTYIPIVLLNIFLGKTPSSALSSWSSFKDAWFARFWQYFGPMSSANASDNIKPLVAQASGVVLDVGTGQGDFLKLYGPHLSQISKVYAVELNRQQWPGLLENARKAGLTAESGKFEILDARIEELETKGGIKRQSVDTIVTLQTLCSMPESQMLIKELRSYLKPGGKWIVYEHVKNDGLLVGGYQKLLDGVWTQCLNGCSLRKDTKGLIEGTGGWKNSLQPAAHDNPWSCFPHAQGVLISE